MLSYDGYIRRIFWSSSFVAAKIAIKLLNKRRTASFAGRLLRYLRVDYVSISLPQRIGHLALEADCYLRDRILRDGRAPLAVIVEPAKGGFVNPVLAEYLSQRFIIVPSIQQGDLVDEALLDAGSVVRTAPYVVAMYDTALCFDLFRRWGRRPPLFTLTEEDKARTAEALRTMGVPAGAWFVCVHARSGGYSPADEHWHAHRNVDISDYQDAMDLIAARGGWCIRMGDATMSPMPPRDKAVDYALSPWKSARLDISLVASCRFYLGCASGLSNIAAMFGRPTALANVTPLSGGYALGVDDLAIPQKIMDADGRILSIDTIFTSELADLRLTKEFKERNLTAVNVTPSEIAGMTAEVMDRLERVATYSAEDQSRQERFRAFLRVGHYAYGTGSQIGRDFLRAHLPLAGPLPTAGEDAAVHAIGGPSIVSDPTWDLIFKSVPGHVSTKFAISHGRAPDRPTRKPLVSGAFVGALPILPDHTVEQIFESPENLSSISVQVVTWGKTASDYQVGWAVVKTKDGESINVGSGTLAADGVADWQVIEMPLASDRVAKGDSVTVSFTASGAQPQAPLGLPLFRDPKGSRDPSAAVDGRAASVDGQIGMTLELSGGVG